MARRPAAEDALPDATKLDAIIADLDELDAAELGKLIAECQKRYEVKREEALKGFVARVREEAAVYQVDLADLFRAPVAPMRPASRSRGRGVVAAKFVSPDGSSKWSGRGRTPAWLAQLEEQGRKREDFLVERPAAELPLAE